MKLVPAGTVLMSFKLSIGRVAMAARPLYTNEAIAAFYPKRADVAPEFLFYALPRTALSTGAAQAVKGLTLNKARLLDLPLPLPPLPEQRRIAAILSSVDDTLERTQAVIDQLEVVKRGLLGELLTRGIPGRHTEFRETEVGVLPAGWRVLSYGELAARVEAAIQSGPFGSVLRHSEFTESGHLVIGIDNVLDGRFSTGANHRISEARFQELRRFQARPLDLLITVMATVGRCCVVPADIEPAIITKHVYRLTVDRTKANPYFLMYCLYGIPRLTRQVRGSAQGLSRPGLNKSLLLPLKFPVPPVEEQEEIVEAMQATEGRQEAEERSLEALRLLKASLLEALLQGKVG